MKKTPTVYVVGNDRSVMNMFTRNGWECLLRMRYADLVQFTGGEDISPILYNQSKHSTTQWLNPWRDKIEATIFNLCIKEKKKIAGICRGMQLINALVGGNMWQDVDGHFGDHKIKDDFYNFTYTSNSVHHQQIIPTKRAYVLAIAQASTKKEKLSENGHLDIYRPTNGKSPDPEVVYWEAYNAFGVQWHPEYACSNQNDLDEIYINYLNDVLMSD